MHSLLQTKEWAALRESQGWKVHSFDDIFILEKQLPFGKNFLYAPEIEWEKINTNLQNFITKIQKNIDISNTIFLRVEILDEFSPEIDKKMLEFGFLKSFEELQPEWRQVIDISKTDDEILAQMREKGRYNVRVAQKHNVTVEKSQNLNDFYEIFAETANRDGFSIRPKQYFEKLLEILRDSGFAELLVAKYNGKVISAEIVTYFKETASYLYGASGNEHRNVMAPYLLHWEAIRRAKEKGCKYYDLLAVTPEESKIENGESKNHKYSGITRFKEQFGGRKVHITGSYDYVYKPVWYKLFKMGEKYRRK